MPSSSAAYDRALRRARALITDALGTAVAARWAAGQLVEAEAVPRCRLGAVLKDAEDALHLASELLLQIEEHGRAAKLPVNGASKKA